MDHEKLLAEYDTLSRRLSTGLTMKAGGAAREAEYSAAYQALVRAGLRPQIKAKYR